VSRLLPLIAVQSSPVPWDVDATWAKYEREVRGLRATFPGTRLILHPELFLAALAPATLPRPIGTPSRSLAEPIPGPLTDRLCALARELDVWLVPGSLYERGEAGVHNTAVAIAPDGTIRAKYRKIFPWRPWEQTVPGNEFVTFDMEDVGRIGLMICYDGWFPEVARHLAWMGAEVILHPSLTQTSDRPQELVLARANAIVNQVYVVNVNAGSSGFGGSLIVGPEGHERQVAGYGEVYLTEVLDLDSVTRVREHGSVAMSRMWAQLADQAGDVSLPLYGGSFAAAAKPPDRFR
jgi:formamidase